MFIARRIVIQASEDVGLANNNALNVAVSAMNAVHQIGMPEARILLAQAALTVALSPKSNTSYMAINSAMADLEAGNSGAIPRQLQNKHFDGEDNQNKGQFYLYPHDYENHYVKQQYLPDELKNKKYYHYGDNKNEQSFKAYWDNIKNNK